MQMQALLIIVATLVCGCQGAGGLPPEASAPSRVTPSAASAVAGDLASRLVEQIGKPQTTSIRLDPDGTDYAAALEAAFKGWGYRVVLEKAKEKDQKPIDVSYALDSFGGQLLAYLATPTIALARSYAVTGAGATPSSPLSIMERN